MLTVISLDEVPEADWHQVIQKEINVAQESLNLHDGPLMRMVYFDEGEHAGRLFWTIHHLAVDGVSWRILLEDLQTAYTQVVQGQKIQLPMKSTSLKNGRRNYIITLKLAYQKKCYITGRSRLNKT